ncbi:heparan-alpha-glucosaminide N-acetyltransferase domain-containing protein [Prosthecobacter vanneervenii]|uniref:Surface polysaccharide O-acyltransferase-like enzyme n=1 Tax=Prosthecobacter vanneervenii TaxID=48466 RepID=A0A7W8DID6_9BACT|nr:surface polysaccharide O-acyltransferase-like enzyme [Prosthecobacter vanneervenii]
MPGSSKRLLWLDLFRGLAVLGMVWTHSANTFLDAGLQKTAWYREMSYYHGLIAPAFFWIAGYVRAHITAGSPKPPLPALKRLLMVLLIGYLMYVPWNDLFHAQAWRAACTVNVLHCLAISGMLMLLAERFGRWRQMVVALFLLFFVGLQTSAEHWHTGLLLIDQYFNRNQGSLFALFPWVGFGLAGFLTRSLWSGTPDRHAAVVFTLGALLAFAQPWSPWPGGAPEFFLERLGWVLMAAVLVACAAERVSSVTGWLRLAGRESLTLYVVHLLFIHAVPLPRQSLQFLIGPTQQMPAVFAIFIVLFLLSLAVGWGNERRKHKQA